MPTSPSRIVADGVLIDEIADWLLGEALGATTMEALFEGCCDRLRAADIPVWRAHLGFRTLHPLHNAVTLDWYADREMSVSEYPHGPLPQAFRSSPHYHMIERSIRSLRRRLDGEVVTLDFPVLEELREAGATDYLAYTIPFDEKNARRADPMVRDGIIGSWTSQREGGFTEWDVAVLRRIARRLAVACRVTLKDQIARNILAAYLGEYAAERVYRGEIARGSGETIHAVIWFSDLRGSTRLSETMPLDEFLGVLNEFFEGVANAILDHGGQVLRFIGDAVLAIFPIAGSFGAEPTEEFHAARVTCDTALTAVRDAIERLAQLNSMRAAAGRAPLRFGTALHVGDVMYGNIGVPHRVEFSVVGRAANHAAKLESLCKKLDVPMLASQAFADIVPAQWVDLGEHRLEGSDAAQNVFTLPELARPQMPEMRAL